MRALVVGASPEPGGEPFYRRLLADADLVVAADAAAEWCVTMGRVPHLAVGDFDSAAPGAVSRLTALGVQVAQHPVAKDASDLDLAVTAALSQRASSVTITACSGGRIDHSLASLGSLFLAAASVEADVQEPGFAAWSIAASQPRGLRLSVQAGTTVSVFAIGRAEGVTLRGGRFPLADATLEPLSSLGLSNVATGPEFSVSASSGTLLVVALATGDSARPTLIRAP